MKNPATLSFKALAPAWHLPSTWIALLLIGFQSGENARAAPLSEFLQDAPKPLVRTYKTIDSTLLNLDIFVPSAMKPADKLPAVVFIHGGAWLAGDASVFFPHARYFASRGAVAISIEYRLAKSVTPTVADCLADCKSAMRYIRAHAAELGIDPNRIAVLGDSAGGHLAGAMGTCEGFDDPSDDLNISSTPNAMILCNPIVDMTDGGWINHIIRGEALAKKPKPESLIPTEDQLKLARELSPLFHVRAKGGRPPTLLMHGLDDHIVSPDQARKFAAVMQESHNRCDLVLIEGARHAFILTRYTAPESRVVEGIRKADQFLVSLHWLSGEPTLEVSNPPAWSPRDGSK